MQLGIAEIIQVRGEPKEAWTRAEAADKVKCGERVLEIESIALNYWFTGEKQKKMPIAA